MNPSSVQTKPIPALSALDSYPWVKQSVAVSLHQQAQLIANCEASFQGKHSVLETLDQIFHSFSSGVVALQGPPGSGVTSVLSYLAANHPYAFWFCDQDSLQGTSALCAQLIALYHLDVPLVPPAAGSDPDALEMILTQVSAKASSDAPAIILIDAPACSVQPRDPFPTLLPAHIPPNVIIVYGCVSDATLPWKTVAQVRLDLNEYIVQKEQQAFLQNKGCSADIAATIAEVAAGNFLYVQLVYLMIQHGLLNKHELQSGLDWLYETWWTSLDEKARRLALVIAAAGEPIPFHLCTIFYESDPQTVLQSWETLDLITKVVYYQPMPESDDDHGQEYDQVSLPDPSISFTHSSLYSHLVQFHPEDIAQVHSDLVALALSEGECNVKPEKNGVNTTNRESSSHGQCRAYLARQLSRHAAFAPVETQYHSIPLVTQRAWVRAQERRHGDLSFASCDAAWELRSLSAQGIEIFAEEYSEGGEPSKTLSDWLIYLGRNVTLTSTLVSLTRSLAPPATVSALDIAIARLGKDSGLKKVLSLVEQLPEGIARSQVLRQMGEACFSRSMRTSAMRLLSQALDLEEMRVPVKWRDQRDHMFATMVQMALDNEDVDDALNISELIAHIEQRGMAETHIMRWLIQKGELVRARKIASAISHENLTAWAQAEVVVAFARSGDMYMAEILLNDIEVETAKAWTQIEVACTLAAHNDSEARERIDQLSNQNQKDQGYARLSQALAQAEHHHKALETAAQIADTTVRIQAFINLRQDLSDIVAFLALKQAAEAILTLKEDVRVPLIAMLASSYALLGHREQAFQVANQLSAGEERDRAFSRIAVALCQYGNYSEALEIARGLSDDDERDWTLAELAQVLADQGHWQESQARAQEIHDERDRDRTLANLSIGFARDGTPLAGFQLRRNIHTPSERIRVLTMTVPFMVEAGYIAEVLSAVEEERQKIQTGHEHAIQQQQLYRFLTSIAIALAQHNDISRAQQITTEIKSSLDQARAFLAISHTAASQRQEKAIHALIAALRCATIDRDTAFRMLEHALPTFVAMGGIQLLSKLAVAINDIDSWIM